MRARNKARTHLTSLGVPLALAAALLLSTYGCSPKTSPSATSPDPSPRGAVLPHTLDDFGVLPAPEILTPGTGHFKVQGDTRVRFASLEAKAAAEQLAALLGGGSALPLDTALPLDAAPSEAETRPTTSALESSPASSVTLQLDADAFAAEAYQLTVTQERVVLQAGDASGLFYGIQTLRQLLNREGGSVLLPSVSIKDRPRFQYRGMHLDVGRHFFGVSEIKRYLDQLARFKFNRFHWHLTEDQGWRIEIKRYPRLTEVGAFRDETLIGHFSERPHRFDGKRYGGFYTQDEVREIVAYAHARHIEVIPEIELPGHALAALASYPELGCAENPEDASYEVASTWGIFDEIYCPKEETFEFLQNVLLEVLDLFPSRYIHIGGDEAPKTVWKKSPIAQAVIKREGLKDEEELQSYFVQRIDRFLQSQGRKLIGWDEILEGGLSEGATVMSWRGEEGGIEAAKQGHDVIMSPNTHVYLNTYQSSDFSSEPPAGKRYLPLRKVYDYEPIPEALSSNEAAHILGAEGCLWTEYIKTEEQLQYMLFPRAIALAEVLWSGKEKRSWSDFSRRLPRILSTLDDEKINYGKHFFRTTQTPSLSKAQLWIELAAPSGDEIRYTLSGEAPTASSRIYDGAFALDKSATVSARAFDAQRALSQATIEQYWIHDGLGSRGEFVHPASDKYPSTGDLALSDGQRGTTTFGDGRWLGFDGTDLDVRFNLKRLITLRGIMLSFLSSPNEWILPPRRVQVWVSADGQSFQEVASKDLTSLEAYEKANLRRVDLQIDASRVRHVRIKASNAGPLPNWHSGKGQPAWLFVDEVQLNPSDP